MGLTEVILTVVVLTIAGALWWLAYPLTPVQIDARGILDRRLGLGRIRWDEIEGAWQPRDGGGRRVQLRLRVTDRLSRLLARRSPAPPPTTLEVPLDLSGTEISGIELLQEIVAHGSDVAPDGR